MYGAVRSLRRAQLRDAFVELIDASEAMRPAASDLKRRNAAIWTPQPQSFIELEGTSR